MNEIPPIAMTEIKATSFPAVKMSWTFIESFVDMQLIAVSRHKHMTARILTMSWGVSQSGKKGFAAYSPNVSAMIAYEVIDENYISLFYGAYRKLLWPTRQSVSNDVDLTTWQLFLMAKWKMCWVNNFLWTNYLKCFLVKFEALILEFSTKRQNV